MEKKRGNQVMAIAALFIAVIGLSLGFAAFSNTLTIKSGATVTPDESNFDIDFTNVNSGTSPVTTNGVVSYTKAPEGATFEVSGGEIDNSAPGMPVVQNLHATFTEPGQSVTFTFYTLNVGHLEGFLREINFLNNQAGIVCEAQRTTTENPENPEETITTTADVTAGLLTAACQDMRMTVTADGVEQVFTNKSGGTNYQNAGTKSIAAHSIATRAFHTVTVKLEYWKDTTANSGAGNYPDGNIEVTFPAVELVYKSVTG